MSDARIKYDGDLMSMRRLMFCLKEEGLQVTVETSRERRDIMATIEAILAIEGGFAATADIWDRIHNAIKKYREMKPDGDKIDVIEPDDDESPDE